MKSAKVLNRIISVEEDVYTSEADARHAELIIRDLGLEGGNVLDAPSQ